MSGTLGGEGGSIDGAGMHTHPHAHAGTHEGNDQSALTSKNNTRVHLEAKLGRAPAAALGVVADLVVRFLQGGGDNQNSSRERGNEMRGGGAGKGNEGDKEEGKEGREN